MKKRNQLSKHKKNLILIDRHFSYTRVAHLKKGVLSDFHLEHSHVPSHVGAVYKAKVTKKQIGLNACFVDIGWGNSAFLYMGKNVYEESGREIKGKESVETEQFSKESVKQAGSEMEAIKNGVNDKQDNYLRQLKKGDTLMVQVIKDPLKMKNLRVSNKISLPGQYLVYLPNSLFHIGVSRQIEDEKLRERLIHCVQEWNKESALVIRTRAAKANEGDLIRDWENLKSIWQNIQEQYQSQKSPGHLWSDIPFSSQILRDFLTEEVEEVLVDDEKMFVHLQGFVSQEIPKEKYKISFYNKGSHLPLFEKYELERELEGLLNKKVRLKSGGFIVIEETEAAVVVDVNTGRFMGKNSPEENILKINLEAVKKIAVQLRLRNCGGIIFIDFIDMELEQSRQKVMELLSHELKQDRSPTQIFPMSELGVVQLTRKRVRSSLLETLCEPCLHCKGLSYVKRPAVLAYEMFRALNIKMREKTGTVRDGEVIFLFCHPVLADWLAKEGRKNCVGWQDRHGRKLIVKKKAIFHREQFEIHTASSALEVSY